MSETIRVMVLVPEDVAGDLAVADRAEGSTVEVTRRPATEGDTGGLSFDPGTIATLVWVGLKITGSTAAKAAVGIIVKEIWDKWKARAGIRGGEIVVRFPNGEQVRLPLGSSVDVQKLQETLKRNGGA